MCTNDSCSGSQLRQASTTLPAPAASRLSAAYAAAPLSSLVAAALVELTGAGAAFTAYDVTMILRALFPYPLRDLPHYDRPGMPGVQPEVHRQMLGYLRSGVYRERTARPNGVDLARLYAPAGRRRTARVVTTTVQHAGSGAGPAGGPLPARAWVVSGGSSPAQTRG